MRWLAAGILLTFGCGRAAEEQPPSTVRFGTSWGIGRPTAAIASTATVHLLDLFSSPAAEQLRVVRTEGNTLRLRALQGAPDEFARRLGHPRLVSAAVDGDMILATFESPVPPLDELRLEGGPFEVVTFEPDSRLVLKRREPSPPSVETVDLHNVASEEELWRRFLVDQVDIVPLASSVHRRRLASVPSVRSATLAQPSTMALRLNMASPKLADPDIRRALALALQRGPIAEAATGSADVAVERPEDAQAANKRLRTSGLRLTILYDRAQTTVAQAMLVVERQWSSVGVQCDFVGANMSVVVDRLKKRDYDVWVFTGGLEARYHYLYLSGTDANFTNYSNASFDEAVRRGDGASAQRILDADTAAIPLYYVQETYAYHARFCNVHPKVTYDLSWLADMRLCRPGERD